MQVKVEKSFVALSDALANIVSENVYLAPVRIGDFARSG
jgi:hypothetical protein